MDVQRVLRCRTWQAPSVDDPPGHPATAPVTFHADPGASQGESSEGEAMEQPEVGAQAHGGSTRKALAQRQASGARLVLAAAALWGPTGTARALGPPGVSPLAVGSARILLGSLALVLLARLGGGLRRVPGRPGAAVALGMASMAAYQLAFFSAVAATGVAVGTVIAIGSAPILAGLLAWTARGERPGGAGWPPPRWPSPAAYPLPWPARRCASACSGSRWRSAPAPPTLPTRSRARRCSPATRPST